LFVLNAIKDMSSALVQVEWQWTFSPTNLEPALLSHAQLDNSE
jgi:hypothetical protein